MTVAELIECLQRFYDHERVTVTIVSVDQSLKSKHEHDIYEVAWVNNPGNAPTKRDNPHVTLKIS